jgi:pimeloyl-ACP methyl ester carboxylesterase
MLYHKRSKRKIAYFSLQTIEYHTFHFMQRNKSKGEELKFRSYDGYKLRGTYLAPQGKTVACLLFVHGITSSRDELGFHSDMAIFLAERGVASLRFDYRFHGVYETSLEGLTLSGILNDIDAAFNALKAKVGDSTPNYFVVGTSFGGGLVAFWVDNCKKNEIKRIILNAPVIDYEDDVLRRNNLIENEELKESVVKKLNSKGYLKSSDIRFGRALINEVRYINGISSLQALGDKVWIFHGKDDEDVPLESSQKFKSKKTGLTIVPNVGHGFGIDIDEDLDHPETKAIHQKIYGDTWSIMEKDI